MKWRCQTVRERAKRPGSRLGSSKKRVCRNRLRPKFSRGSVDAVDTKADQLIDGEVLHAAGLQSGNELGRDAMNAHGDELVRLRMLIAERLYSFDKVRRYAMDTESDQFLQVNVIVAVRSEERRV